MNRVDAGEIVSKVTFSIYFSVALQTITVNVVIGHMISHVESVLLYKNTKPNAIETEFKFSLDEGSAIYKMEAEIDRKTLLPSAKRKDK